MKPNLFRGTAVRSSLGWPSMFLFVSMRPARPLMSWSAATKCSNGTRSSSTR